MKHHQTIASVLIIEDELVLAADLKEVIEELGHRVVGIASSLTRAEEIFRQGEVNLILADIHLGKGAPVDGIQIVQRLTDQRNVPVIFTTAHDDEEYRRRTRFLFPAAYLIKPLKQRQLDVTIEFSLYNYFESGQARRRTTRLADDRAYYVKHGQRYMRVWASEMCYVSADGNNCCLFTKGRKYYLSLSMGAFLEEFGAHFMERIHRSHAVNKNCVQAYDANYLYLLRDHGVDSVPYSDSYKDQVETLFPIIRPIN